MTNKAIPDLAAASRLPVGVEPVESIVNGTSVRWSLNELFKRFTGVDLPLTVSGAGKIILTTAAAGEVSVNSKLINLNANVDGSTIRLEAEGVGSTIQFVAADPAPNISLSGQNVSLSVGGSNIKVSGLPTADPMVADTLWLNAGVLTISAA